MTKDIVISAYESWCKTGELVKDKTIVMAMFYRFDMIANSTLGIPKYDLIHNDARKESDRLRDIIRRRGYNAYDQL